jgi:hypothetical protein
MEPLNEQELDISMGQGFLEEWLKDAPGAVKDNLKTLADGVSFYRQKYLDAQQDYTELQEKYSQLTALSSSYLALLSQQKEQIDQLLIETQREFHKTESES